MSEAGQRTAGTAAAVPSAAGTQTGSSATTAAAAGQHSESSIIAASWRLDPPGSSPPGPGLWGSLPAGLADPSMTGLYCSPSPPGSIAGATPNGTMQHSGANALSGSALAGGATDTPAAQQQRGFAVPRSGTQLAVQLSSSPGLHLGGGSGSLGSGLGAGSFSGGSFGHLRRRATSPPGLLSTSLRSLQSLHSLGHGGSSGLGVAHSVGSGLGQVLGQSVGSHWQDEEAEFFSIAGDSSSADELSLIAEDEQHSIGGSPSKQALDSTAGAAGAAAADDEELLFQELLPLAGFDKDGCLATARWLLLSLAAGGGTSGTAAALQLTVSEGKQLQTQQCNVACAATIVAGNPSGEGTEGRASHQPQQQLLLHQQRISVALLGWQLQVSGKHWDMVAACVMQAYNATTAAAVGQKAAAAAVSPRSQQGQQQQPPSAAAQPDASSSTSQQPSVALAAVAAERQQLQLLVDVQQLQVTLFLAPDSAAPANPRQERQQQWDSLQHSSCHNRDCGPWQDPGGSPTAAAAAEGDAGSASSAAQGRRLSSGLLRTSGGLSTLLAAEQATQQQQQLAAQTLTLTLSVSAAADTSAGPGQTAAETGSHGLQQPEQQMVLQSIKVPELSVSVGAAPWDMAAAKPVSSTGNNAPDVTGGKAPTAATAAADQQQQQQPLLLVLLKGLQVQYAATAAAAFSAPEDANRPAGSLLEAQPASTGLMFEVQVGCVSSWVSTTRLSLLMNLQQQLNAQLPAITAAADMAGGFARYRPEAAAAAPAAATPRASGATAAGSTAAGGATGSTDHTASSAAPLVGCNSSSFTMVGTDGGSFAMKRTSSRSAGTSSSSISIVSCSLVVHKLAVLCSTDEPEPWLLQQHSSSTSSSRASGDRLSSSIGGIAALAAGRGDSAPAFTTCTTPLLEAALLPLQVDVQLAPSAAAVRGGRTSGSGSSGGAGRVLRVAVRAKCLADVYNVDKLGWEPLLEPWEFKVRVIGCRHEW